MKPAIRQRIRNANTPEPVAQTDEAGNVFDPELHIAPDQKTNAGTFRLKPGKSHK